VSIAVLRYRLYDVDVVINKTVVFGALAAFITAVYVGIVVGIGAAIGQGSKPNLALSILATAARWTDQRVPREPRDRNLVFAPDTR